MWLSCSLVEYVARDQRIAEISGLSREPLTLLQVQALPLRALLQGFHQCPARRFGFKTRRIEQQILDSSTTRGPREWVVWPWRTGQRIARVCVPEQNCVRRNVLQSGEQVLAFLIGSYFYPRARTHSGSAVIHVRTMVSLEQACDVHTATALPQR